MMAFKIVDEDGSGTISFDEFVHWIKHDDEIQNFILRQTGVQTHERAVRRFQEDFEKWLLLFHEVAVNYMGTYYAEVKDL